MCLLAAGCKGGFDPVEREGSDDGNLTVDASLAPTPDAPPSTPTPDAAPAVPCQMRIPNTDNAYLPRAQCFSELDQARTTCNADTACVLTGYYWGPGTGVNDTGACADGGGNTGCRQWVCSPKNAVPQDHRTI